MNLKRQSKFMARKIKKAPKELNQLSAFIVKSTIEKGDAMFP